MRSMLLVAVTILGVGRGWPSDLLAAAPKAAGPDAVLYQKTVDRAVQFLSANQAQDGALSPQIGIGPTALATLGLLRSGRPAADPQVAKGLKYLEHPGMGDSGLFYYYVTFAKTLDALGLDRIEDDRDLPHDWRRELTAELARRQKDNGSWVNTNTRWMEGDPNLATAFALLALSYCRPPAAH